jgi:hypothetical protein
MFHYVTHHGLRTQFTIYKYRLRLYHFKIQNIIIDDGTLGNSENRCLSVNVLSYKCRSVARTYVS